MLPHGTRRCRPRPSGRPRRRPTACGQRRRVGAWPSRRRRAGGGRRGSTLRRRRRRSRSGCGLPTARVVLLDGRAVASGARAEPGGDLLGLAVGAGVQDEELRHGDEAMRPADARHAVEPRDRLRVFTDAAACASPMRRARAGARLAVWNPHVVIAGGGVGALEGLLALQAVGADRVRISVLTATRHLTYRALSVAEPFGGDPAPRFDWEQITRDRGVRWIPDVVERVRPEARELDTRDGPPVGYDALLLALGARPAAGAARARSRSPGRATCSRSARRSRRWSPGGATRSRSSPPPASAWTLPLYELALMTAEHGRRRGLDLAIELVTRESTPLGLFGAEASAAVARRLDAGRRPRAHRHVRRSEVRGREALARARGRARRPTSSSPCRRSRAARRRAAGGPRRLRAGRPLRPRPRRRPRLGGGRHDDAPAQAGRPRRAAGRRRRGRHRGPGRRRRLELRPYKPKLRGLLLTGSDPVFLERRPHAPPRSEASAEFLWWPAHKVVGRHLGPYLESLAR